jgi:tetratricopeptide (TPR) repeat protein
MTGWRTAAVAALGVVFAGVVPASALAMGDSDSGSGAAPTAPPKCKPGEVWDPEASRLFGKGRCVSEAEMKKGKDEQQGLIYDYGKALADAGEYRHAISVLHMAPDQSDARVLNYLGFSWRKLGDFDRALAHYQAAIALDPDYSLVREYLGEAYLQLGMLEAARAQLSAIERICGGRSCEAYDKLAGLMIESQL